MDLGELGDFLEGSFNFTIDGRRYEVPPIAWPVYLRYIHDQEHLANVAAGRAKPGGRVLTEQTAEEFWAEVLSQNTLDKLIGDAVPGKRIALIARAGYLFHIGQEEAAKVLLSSAGKASAPKESTSTTRTGSTGTGAATTTRRRGSTSTTKSPRKSQKPNAAAGKR